MKTTTIDLYVGTEILIVQALSHRKVLEFRLHEFCLFCPVLEEEQTDGGGRVKYESRLALFGYGTLKSKSIYRQQFYLVLFFIMRNVYM